VQEDHRFWDCRPAEKLAAALNNNKYVALLSTKLNTLTVNQSITITSIPGILAVFFAWGTGTGTVLVPSKEFCDIRIFCGFVQLYELFIDFSYFSAMSILGLR
jgi:hypothetical protein